ncbi:hypothetical protein SLOPH_625 [Spraguea lophii 42_110]|uniref:Uncharacterized protein n=1 Tax=Spraguea lophii (strain 42_110) TaxID=1358809 RepID=S7W533_SPRLO|nr:hypothetical protein SLOPH_625 [Spraguea lophii 42_110]
MIFSIISIFVGIFLMLDIMIIIQCNEVYDGGLSMSVIENRINYINRCNYHAAIGRGVNFIGTVIKNSYNAINTFIYDKDDDEIIENEYCNKEEDEIVENEYYVKLNGNYTFVKCINCFKKKYKGEYNCRVIDEKVILIDFNEKHNSELDLHNLSYCNDELKSFIKNDIFYIFVKTLPPFPDFKAHEHMQVIPFVGEIEEKEGSSELLKQCKKIECSKCNGENKHPYFVYRLMCTQAEYCIDNGCDQCWMHKETALCAKSLDIYQRIVDMSCICYINNEEEYCPEDIVRVYFMWKIKCLPQAFKKKYFRNPLYKLVEYRKPKKIEKKKEKGIFNKIKHKLIVVKRKIRTFFKELDCPIKDECKYHSPTCPLRSFKNKNVYSL